MTPLRRLTNRLDPIWERGVIEIVNQDRFAWNDVHVEVGEGHQSFQCPASPTIGSGHRVYLEAVESAFNEDIDYAMLQHPARAQRGTDCIPREWGRETVGV